jgi:hypothetical protein
VAAAEEGTVVEGFILKETLKGMIENIGGSTKEALSLLEGFATTEDEKVNFDDFIAATVA